MPPEKSLVRRSNTINHGKVTWAWATCQGREAGGRGVLKRGWCCIVPKDWLIFLCWLFSILFPLPPLHPALQPGRMTHRDLHWDFLPSRAQLDSANQGFVQEVRERGHLRSYAPSLLVTATSCVSPRMTCGGSKHMALSKQLFSLNSRNSSPPFAFSGRSRDNDKRAPMLPAQV